MKTTRMHRRIASLEFGRQSRCVPGYDCRIATDCNIQNHVAGWPRSADDVSDRPIGRISVRVYYEDTDFSGRVYHASYLRFLERGRTEWLRGFGFGHREIAAKQRARVRGPKPSDRVPGSGADGRSAGRRDPGVESSRRIARVSSADRAATVASSSPRRFWSRPFATIGRREFPNRCGAHSVAMRLVRTTINVRKSADRKPDRIAPRANPDVRRDEAPDRECRRDWGARRSFLATDSARRGAIANRSARRNMADSLLDCAASRSCRCCRTAISTVCRRIMRRQMNAAALAPIEARPATAHSRKPQGAFSAGDTSTSKPFYWVLAKARAGLGRGRRPRKSRKPAAIDVRRVAARLGRLSRALVFAAACAIVATSIGPSRTAPSSKGRDGPGPRAIYFAEPADAVAAPLETVALTRPARFANSRQSAFASG